MPTKRSYSLKRIRKDYTYAPEEIAEIFGIAASTVFRWIREEGLKRIDAGKKYYVHSTDLKAFMNKRKKERQVKCNDNEFYCFKCKTASGAEENSIKIKKLPNKTVRISARCVVCNCKMNKTVSGSKYNENHPLFIALHEVDMTLNTESEPPLECNSLGELKND